MRNTIILLINVLAVVVLIAINVARAQPLPPVPGQVLCGTVPAKATSFVATQGGVWACRNVRGTPMCVELQPCSDLKGPQ